MKAFLATILAVLTLTLGCATMKPEAAAHLRVECNVPDAMVLLDDNLVAKAADLAKKDKAVRPGFYRVELRHPGYYSFFTEVSVEEGARATVKAELHPLLD